jgi:hypothetical protein
VLADPAIGAEGHACHGFCRRPWRRLPRPYFL